MIQTKPSSLAWSQWAALGAMAAFLLAMALMKVSMVDVPWHLATGRLIVEEGVLPTTNTFSWTHPDSTLFQQYPLFQMALFVTWKLAGYAGLSVLTAVLWMAVVLVWVRWTGTWAQIARFAPIWMIALLGVQRHLLLRPEVLSLLFLGILLRLLDRIRMDPRWRWVAGIVLVQWMWANSHQLFGIGLGVQVAFLAHVLLTRSMPNSTLFSNEDQGLSTREVLVAIGGSLIASAMTPLGFRSLLIPIQSVNTLLTQGASAGVAQSAELLPLWSDRIAGIVVVVGVVLLMYAAFRTRGRWLWFDLALVVLGIALAMAALRGIGFFSLIVFGVVARWLRLRPRERKKLVLDYGSALVITASLVFIAARLGGQATFLNVQSGLGREVGTWPDATIAYLDSDRPDGEMLNIGWGSGNVLIWEGFDVFIDPRWESYPKEFLLDSIAAVDDPNLLARQIAEWDPSWIVAELRLPAVQERMSELVADGEWGVVHLDTLHLVLVRGALNDPSLEAVGWHPAEPVLHAQEKIRVACWYDHQGQHSRAQQLRSEALGVAAAKADATRFGECGVTD